MKMNRKPADWAVVSTDAVVAGSTAQARNVLEMALQDIAVLAADRDRTERNRDMWKGQCERQAEKLSARCWQPMETAPKDGTYILAQVAPDRGGHLEYHPDRMFVIRHEGKNARGFDLGWAVYPGLGGVSERDFSHWQPLPATPGSVCGGPANDPR